jgi:hypothetical protein
MITRSRLELLAQRRRSPAEEHLPCSEPRILRQGAHFGYGKSIADYPSYDLGYGGGKNLRFGTKIVKGCRCTGKVSRNQQSSNPRLDCEHGFFPTEESEFTMLRKICFASLVVVGSVLGGNAVVKADHCHHQRGYAPPQYFSGYRPPVNYYSSSYSAWGAPMYRPYVGQPIPSSFSHGHSSYFGGNHASGFNAPFGGYGVSGFPRQPGFSLYIGR